MDNQFIIRNYKPSDKVALTTIMQLLIPQYFNYNEMADFQLYLNNEIEEYYIIEEKGIIIGCGGINTFPQEKLGKISWDMMHPTAQGKGYGSKLLNFRIQKLIANQAIDKIQVRTSQLAYPFYNKHGFILKQVIPNYWAAGYDLYDLILEKGE